MSDESPLRIAILGAGPIGLEAALYARYLGYQVELFEQGGSVATHVQRWGHVRLFSPFCMNATSLGVAAIEAQDPSWQRPAASDRLLAYEHHQRYLQPLAETDLVNASVRLNTEVVAIGRPRWLKGEGVGDPHRAARPFRLLTRATDKGQVGAEAVVEADVVIDCTGTYGNHNWLGQGGIPAIGERPWAEQGGKREGEIEYGLPDVLGTDRGRYAGRHVLVVGAGYSAATTVVGLAELATSQPGTRISWVTRGRRMKDGPDRGGPMERIVEDRLADRDRLAASANALATGATGPVTWLPGQAVVATRYDPQSDGWDVMLDGLPTDDTSSKDAASEQGEATTLQVERIVANVGYRPDQSLYSELQVHTCYATDGPMELAAQLMAQSQTLPAPADCLDETSQGPESLLTTEPNFYLLGSKSYGRRSQFLLSIGFEQIRDLFTILGEREDLDLYTTMRPIEDASC
jgi:hypothetical protein